MGVSLLRTLAGWMGDSLQVVSTIIAVRVLILGHWSNNFTVHIVTLHQWSVITVSSIHSLKHLGSIMILVFNSCQ